MASAVSMIHTGKPPALPGRLSELELRHIPSHRRFSTILDDKIDAKAKEKQR